VWCVCVCVKRVTVEQNMLGGVRARLDAEDGGKEPQAGRQQNAETRGGGALSCCLRVGSARAFDVVVVCE